MKHTEKKTKGAVCLSFDDGRKDNRIVAELLKEMKIPASFNITTGYVDDTCPQNLRPTDKEALSIDDVRWLYMQSLFEIALHGDNHLNTEEDIENGRKKLIEWLDLSDNIIMGFASPGTGINLQILNDRDNKLFFEEISYVRVGLRIKSKKIFRIFARKISRVFHSAFLYRFAYADTLMDYGEEKKIIYSVPIMGDITYKQVAELIKYCSKKDKLLVLMFHSIESETNDTWSWNSDKFKKMCCLLDNMRIKNMIDIWNVQELYENI